MWMLSGIAGCGGFSSCVLGLVLMVHYLVDVCL